MSEPGYLVRGLCGREWFVPLEAVGRDYAEFLRQADGLTAAEAKAKAEENREFWPDWFAEQCGSWSDIDRLGRLTKAEGKFKTRQANDRLRGGGRVEYVKSQHPAAKEPK